MRSSRFLGLALAGVGLVWLGQGLGFIPGSFMTGSSLWAVIGAVCVTAGVVILFVKRRRK